MNVNLFLFERKKKRGHFRSHRIFTRRNNIKKKVVEVDVSSFKLKVLLESLASDKTEILFLKRYYTIKEVLLGKSKDVWRFRETWRKCDWTEVPNLTNYFTLLICVYLYIPYVVSSMLFLGVNLRQKGFLHWKSTPHFYSTTIGGLQSFYHTKSVFFFWLFNFFFNTNDLISLIFLTFMISPSVFKLLSES